jgi:GTP-binding protein
MLVDLPGYGYAEAGRAEIDKWGKLIEGYFAATQKLVHTFALVDIRHEPSKLDLVMIKFLYASGLPFTVIATKADKIKKSQMAKHLQMLASVLAIGKDNIIPCSTLDKIGREAVLARLGQVLAEDDADGE